VSIQGKNAVVDFSGCTFKGNTAKASGGAVSSYDGTVSFDQCHFESNVSNATGGAIYNNSCRLTITGTTFKSNTSVTAAGALSNEVGTVIIDGCKFISNSSPNHGAAVCTYGEKLSGNDTIEGRAELYVYNTLFEDNGDDTATDQGGAVKAHGNGDMVIVNSTFKGNGAKNGIIRFRSQVAESVKAWVISCTFSGNNKYSLYNQSSNLTVCNSVMDDLNSYRSNNKAGKLVVQKSVFNNAGHSMVQNLDFTGEVKDNAALSGASTLENTVVGSFADGVFSVSGAALTGGMSSDELSALGSDIKAAMPLFDESKLLVDQNGNSRVGKTVMGASVQ
jgi:predicted outer membrane repeat protein